MEVPRPANTVSLLETSPVSASQMRTWTKKRIQLCPGCSAVHYMAVGLCSEMMKWPLTVEGKKS